MSVQNFLAKSGFSSFSSEAHWVNALKKQLGDARFTRFQEQVKAVHEGHLDGRNLYDTLYKVEEFQLVFSRHLEVLVLAYQAIENLMIEIAPPNANTWLDLGCGVGTFLSYLEQEHQHKGKGVDTLGNALMMAADSCSQGQFFLWDFQKAPTQELVNVHQAFCIFGVDFHSLPQLQPEGINRFAPYLSKDSEFHRYRSEEALVIWENWSESLQEAKTMIQVLRIAWFDHLVAWVDAAKEWDWGLRSITWVETDDERFPMMHWERDFDDQQSIQDLIGFWQREI